MAKHKNVGSLVRKKRLSHEKQYSQSELSLLVGDDEYLVSEIERGLKGGTIEAFADLCRILRISEDELAEAIQKDREEGF